MDNKLQELTQRVYAEGVERANLEAEKIKSEAENEAKRIIAEAENKAQSIENEARRNAAELERNTRNDLQMASSQIIQSLKNDIKSLIATKVVDAPIKETFADKDFIISIITKAVEGFSQKSSSDLAVILPENDFSNLNQRIQNSVSSVLKSELTITSGNIKGGFKIGPKEENYYITFTDEDFISLFRNFVKGNIEFSK
ncbi:MAG: V-type ATP synthase subunit E [Marinilabiliaceae bacterium]|mgnify:CR=1 FL=1|nr:V-type ATP synthase subunit E [Marinilabiliaceae bacterium]